MCSGPRSRDTNSKARWKALAAAAQSPFFSKACASIAAVSHGALSSARPMPSEGKRLDAFSFPLGLVAGCFSGTVPTPTDCGSFLPAGLLPADCPGATFRGAVGLGGSGFDCLLSGCCCELVARGKLCDPVCAMDWLNAGAIVRLPASRCSESELTGDSFTAADTLVANSIRVAATIMIAAARQTNLHISTWKSMTFLTSVPSESVMPLISGRQSRLSEASTLCNWSVSGIGVLSVKNRGR